MVRDYMPFSSTKIINFIKYRYYPAYLLGSQDDKDTITNSSRACKLSWYLVIWERKQAYLY